MPNLIAELKHEHMRITDTFKKVIELGIGSEEGKKLLFSTKAYLLAHLKKEDLELYPALWEEAQNNNELKNTLEAYALEMDEISKAALAFFDKYASGGDASAFPEDYKQLYRVLNRRIINEESVIYKRYAEFQL